MSLNFTSFRCTKFSRWRQTRACVYPSGIWNTVRVISAAQILNALMNILHPIPFIPRLRAVSYHSTLRAHVKSERRSREEREWKLSLHPNLSSFLPLICIILLFRSPRVALRQKKNEPPFAV